MSEIMVATGSRVVNPRRSIRLFVGNDPAELSCIRLSDPAFDARRCCSNQYLVPCRQARKISRHIAAGSEPCDALCDVATRRLDAEEVGSLGGYSLLGPVEECSIDDGVPSCTTIRNSWPLSKRISDPFGRLVGKGDEVVLMSVAGLTVGFQVFDEKFSSVIGGDW